MSSCDWPCRAGKLRRVNENKETISAPDQPSEALLRDLNKVRETSVHKRRSHGCRCVCRPVQRTCTRTRLQNTDGDAVSPSLLHAYQQALRFDDILYQMIVQRLTAAYSELLEQDAELAAFATNLSGRTGGGERGSMQGTSAPKVAGTGALAAQLQLQGDEAMPLRWRFVPPGAKGVPLAAFLGANRDERAAKGAQAQRGAASLKGAPAGAVGGPSAADAEIGEGGAPGNAVAAGKTVGAAHVPPALRAPPSLRLQRETSAQEAQQWLQKIRSLQREKLAARGARRRAKRGGGGGRTKKGKQKGDPARGRKRPSGGERKGWGAGVDRRPQHARKSGKDGD